MAMPVLITVSLPGSFLYKRISSSGTKIMAQFSNSDTSDDAACVRAIISHAMVIKKAVPITVPASKSRAARLRTALLKISARSTKAIIKRTAKRLKGARLSKIC